MNRPLRQASIYIPLAVVVFLLAVRCVAVFQLKTDSDEAQHLHMIYGWIGGELPYRDRFDNHTPLLYMLFLPLAALAGETPQIILLARLAEFPIGLVMLGLIYLIGRRFVDREVALWVLATTLAFLPSGSLSGNRGRRTLGDLFSPASSWVRRFAFQSRRPFLRQLSFWAGPERGSSAETSDAPFLCHRQFSAFLLPAPDFFSCQRRFSVG